MELFRAGRRDVCRVYLHKPGGISLDECAEASHLISEVLDTDETFESAYTLEVSSPGLDRPLKTAQDWARRHGEWIRAHLIEEVEDRKQWIGKLVASDETTATLAPGGSQPEVRIPFSAVQLARVDVRFED